MRRIPPLAALRAFEAAARHLSFSRAADELRVTPTAVSHHIRSLEEFCGQRLFQRRPRPLALTRAGESLFPVLRAGLDAFAAAIVSISRNDIQRTLRVTATNAFAGRWLVPRLALWQQAHPDVALEVIGADAVLNLHASEADVAIRYARGVPRDSSAQEIFRDRFIPVCTPSVLAKGAGPIRRAGDLLAYPLIHFDWAGWDVEAPTWDRWLMAARSADPELPQRTRPWDLSFREELHAIDAVIAGQGIGICSDVLVGRELRSGALVRAHEFSLPGYTFYVVHLADHPALATIAAFSDWMRTVDQLSPEP